MAGNWGLEREDGAIKVVQDPKDTQSDWVPKQACCGMYTVRAETTKYEFRRCSHGSHMAIS